MPLVGITPEKASAVRKATVSNTRAQSLERVRVAKKAYEKENPVRASVKPQVKQRRTLAQAGSTWKAKQPTSLTVPANPNPCKNCGTPTNGQVLCGACAKLQRNNGKGHTRQTKNSALVNNSVASTMAKDKGDIDGLRERIDQLKETIVQLNEERDVEEEYRKTEKAYEDKKLKEFEREEKRRELEAWSCSYYEDQPHRMLFLIVTNVMLPILCTLIWFNYPMEIASIIQFYLQGIVALVVVDSILSIRNGRVTVWNGHLRHSYRFVRHVEQKDKEYSDCRALAIASGEMLFEDPRGFVFSYTRTLFGFSIGAATPFGRKEIFGVASYELLCQLCVHKNIDSDLDDKVALDKLKWMSKTMHAINQSKYRATFPQGAIPEKTCRIAYGILRQARNECADFPAPSMH